MLAQHLHLAGRRGMMSGMGRCWVGTMTVALARRHATLALKSQRCGCGAACAVLRAGVVDEAGNLSWKTHSEQENQHTEGKSLV